MKYRRIDPERRTRLRKEWNRPVLRPILLLIGLIAVGMLPALVSYLRKNRAKGVRN